VSLEEEARYRALARADVARLERLRAARWSALDVGLGLLGLTALVGLAWWKSGAP
jgi:hypothetical protein